MAETPDIKALTESHRELETTLRMARECIAYCRQNHSDPQSGTGIPVEALIDAALDRARKLTGDGA